MGRARFSTAMALRFFAARYRGRVPVQSASRWIYTVMHVRPGHATQVLCMLRISLAIQAVPEPSSDGLAFFGLRRPISRPVDFGEEALREVFGADANHFVAPVRKVQLKLKDLDAAG